MATISPMVWAAINQSGLAWLPQSLLSAFADGWVSDGSVDSALTSMREHPDYAAFFPGNLRPDGTARLIEGTYLNLIDDYRTTLREAGVDPSYFPIEQLGALVEGEVSAQEFQTRVNAITVGVRQRSDRVREFYASTYGVTMTDSDLIASVMDPAVGDAILSERIQIAAIGGAAAERGFSISEALANRMQDRGWDYDQASSIFAEAGLNLPTLDRLSRRHADPNDPFDLDDYLNAAAFGDADAQLSVRRLQSAAVQSFRSPTRGFVDRNTGSLTGLVDR